MKACVLKGIYLSKTLTCLKLFLYKQKFAFFMEETDTFGLILSTQNTC